MLYAVRHRYTILAAQLSISCIIMYIASHFSNIMPDHKLLAHVLHFVTAEYWCNVCHCQTWMSSNILVLNWAAVSDTDQQMHFDKSYRGWNNNPQYGGLSCQWDDVGNITNVNGGQISSWLFVDNLSLDFETASLLNVQD